MTMKTSNASVVDLKTHMGRYLSRVKRGETIVVTSHRHPVARLIGVADAQDVLEVTPPERPLKDLVALLPLRLTRAVEGVDALVADRQRR